MKSERAEPALLRRINQRCILKVIQRSGASSRATLARMSGLTPPTVSKVVESLLMQGIVEEFEQDRPPLGRPHKLVKMATTSAVVLGVVIDAGSSCVTETGLDGQVTEEKTLRFRTPDTYERLLDELEQRCRTLLSRTSAKPRGVGISVPGLVSERLKQVVFCPNLHLLDHRNPALDLEKRLGIECLLMHELQALCLAERMYGVAGVLDNFAMLDVTQGLGLGVVVGGMILTGNSGMAGEIGHITADPTGIRCGCGNRGCLETLATDAALMRMMQDRVKKPLTLAEAAAMLDEQGADFESEIQAVTGYLAIAIAVVINTFNPTTVFVHGKLLVENKDRFDRVVDGVRQRTLMPLLAECTIVPTRSSKRQGAIAGIMHWLTEGRTPGLGVRRQP
ncbi:MAG: ROK family transcriptional regulator [Planctomycetia bacterium]|jgi:N-acetylglucosamine repressor|nr:ROK family transcriptional regulator [Planctomycetia bacterium]